MKIDWKKILAVVGGLVVLVGVAYAASFWNESSDFDKYRICCGGETSTVEDDISEWNTYRNEEYGFEMRHPPGLVTKIGGVSYGGSRGFYIAFVESGKSRSYFTIEVFDVGSVEDINEAVSLAIKTDVTSLDKRVIQVDGRNAYYYQEVPGFVPYEEIFVIKGSRLYGFAKPVYRGYEMYFEKILSTFKFIEPEVDTVSTYDGGWVKIVSPNGGEKLYFGDKYEVKWESNNTSSVNIILVSRQCLDRNCFDPHESPVYAPNWPDYAMLGREYMQNNGFFLWGVGDFSRTLTWDGGPMPATSMEAGEYKVFIRQASEGVFPELFSDSSDSFFFIEVPEYALAGANRYMESRVGLEYFYKNFNLIGVGSCGSNLCVNYDYLPVSQLAGSRKTSSIVFEDRKVKYGENILDCAVNPSVCVFSITKADAINIAVSKGFNVSFDKFSIELNTHSNYFGSIGYKGFVWLVVERGFKDQYGCPTKKEMEINLTNGIVSDVKMEPDYMYC